MRKHPVMLGMLILIILGVFSYFFSIKPVYIQARAEVFL